MSTRSYERANTMRALRVAGAAMAGTSSAFMWPLSEEGAACTAAAAELVRLTDT